MKRQTPESGFALLFVFLMAAAIAIMLYAQLPRAAFESQRMKEEMLIDRGEQYIRAIQLYTSEWKQYPQSVEQLEKTNNKRYLRGRYKDPITGKDEWRLLHINAAGVLTDSVLKKDEKKQNQNTFITENPGIGVEQNTGTAGVNIALRRRPSDGAPEGSSGAPLPPSGESPLGQGPQASQPPPDGSQSPGSQVPPNAAQPNVPGAPVPGMPGFPPAPNGQPVSIDPRTGQPVLGQGLQPGAPSAAPQTGYPAPQGIQGYPPPTGIQQQGVQPGIVQPTVGGGIAQQGMQPAGQQPTVGGGMAQPGQPNGPSVGQGVGQGSNQAVQMIQGLLTSPRPQGANGGMQVPGAPGLTIGGGIAGVASKAESDSIKLYNDRQKYNEWEFVYDMKKDKRLQKQAGMSGQGLGTGPLSQPPGSVPPQQQQGFGQQPLGPQQPGQPPFGQQPGVQQPPAGGGFATPGGRR